MIFKLAIYFFMSMITDVIMYICVQTIVRLSISHPLVVIFQPHAIYSKESYSGCDNGQFVMFDFNILN
jgi:hypothetical protein